MVALFMKSMVWPGPATKPSNDIMNAQCTFPAATCGFGSCMIPSVSLVLGRSDLSAIS